MKQYNDDVVKTIFGEQYSSVCHPTFIKDSVIDLEPCNNEWTLPIRTQEELTAITGRKNGIKKHMDNWFKWRKATIHSDSFDKIQESQDRLKESKEADKAYREAQERVKQMKEYLKVLEAEELMTPEELKAKRDAELLQQQYKAQRDYDNKDNTTKLLMISDAHVEFNNNVDIGSTIKVHASWIPNYYDGSCFLMLEQANSEPVVTLVEEPATIIPALTYNSVESILVKIPKHNKPSFIGSRTVDWNIKFSHNLSIESTNNQGEFTMNTNFHNTSINNQPTTLDAIYKGIYSEMVCMTQYAAKQNLIVATYKAAVKEMVKTASIFTRNTLTFTMEQLLAIKGIGSVKAQAIIDYCKKYAVTSIHNLAHVKGVGAVLLNTLVNHKF